MNSLRFRQPADRHEVGAWVRHATEALARPPEGYRLALVDDSLVLVPTDLAHAEPCELSENQRRRVRVLVEVA